MIQCTHQHSTMPCHQLIPFKPLPLEGVEPSVPLTTLGSGSATNPQVISYPSNVACEGGGGGGGGGQLITLAEYYHMITHLPGFQSFLIFFASFYIDKINHQQFITRVMGAGVMRWYNEGEQHNWLPLCPSHPAFFFMPVANTPS